ncbi:MAG: prepilin peptidase [Clostridia bacterium]|nr:prepilin peptidase [Clostridia bacterium]
MYINDINILYYVLVGIAGIIIGGFVDYCNKMFLKEEKILSKKNLKEYTKTSKPNYILMVITAIGYIALLYKFGSTDLIKFSMYICLIPMLLSAFVVDYKEQIIPNRLNLTMFEIGLVFVFIYGMTNLSIAIDMLLGMLVGGGIFLLITLIGGAIAGKEAMGLRRCKTNGSIRIILWICKHNNNIYNVIFNRSNS